MTQLCTPHIRLQHRKSTLLLTLRRWSGLLTHYRRRSATTLFNGVDRLRQVTFVCLRRLQVQFSTLHYEEWLFAALYYAPELVTT